MLGTPQFRELIAAVIRWFPDMDETTAQAWIDNQDGLRATLRTALVPDTAQLPVVAETKSVPAPGTLSRTILVPLYVGEEIMVAETDGSETMAGAKKVFTGYLDGDFKNWKTNQPSSATKAQPVMVYEMREDARFAEMFGSLGDLDKLIMTQSQIIKFCVDHRDKLRQEGYGTFFLFKVGEEFFVAHVHVAGRKLFAFVFRFDSSFVWFADSRPRVVVPQL